MFYAARVLACYLAYSDCYLATQVDLLHSIIYWIKGWHLSLLSSINFPGRHWLLFSSTCLHIQEVPSSLMELSPYRAQRCRVGTMMGYWELLCGAPIFLHTLFLKPWTHSIHDHCNSPGLTGHGTTDWFQIRKGVLQGCILSPCLFNLYAEYIMRNARLDEAQAGIRLLGETSIT